MGHVQSQNGAISMSSFKGACPVSEVEDTAPKGGVVRSLYECKTSFAFVEYNIVDMQYIYIYYIYTLIDRYTLIELQ